MCESGDDIDVSTASKENDDLFLDLIKERPCLYDKTLADYRDKIVIENAMEEIAFIMQDSVENCEKKWKEFKQAYTRETDLQELESRSGSGASTRKQWTYFERMK
ncbi:hypothetical protein TSAR_005611 [Trichomalopsis sarcophagae]|uniref:MADF domain-containing protein n=1 Tax=Trichomalopsis sarcophagae TaxID=543379 RepID=A0A232EGQ4_9HYME|nr:hypothetical protein TSAR_005611 [Trichomalopsis sarcophagae]